MQSIWQLKRSEFNHDWLKNQFLNRLNAFLERLRGENPDAEKLSRFVREHLSEWNAHEPEARWLIDSLENELSPKRFFDQPPLSNCDSETKSWLPTVVHEIWLSRYPVRELREKATGSLAKVNEQYAKLSSAVEKSPSLNAGSLVGLRHEFSELSHLCVELHDTFSAFDVKIKRV
jgi:hypothetical protein